MSRISCSFSRLAPRAWRRSDPGSSHLRSRGFQALALPSLAFPLMIVGPCFHLASNTLSTGYKSGFEGIHGQVAPRQLETTARPFQTIASNSDLLLMVHYLCTKFQIYAMQSLFRSKARRCPVQNLPLTTSDVRLEPTRPLCIR